VTRDTRELRQLVKLLRQHVRPGLKSVTMTLDASWSLALADALDAIAQYRDRIEADRLPSVDDMKASRVMRAHLAKVAAMRREVDAAQDALRAAIWRQVAIAALGFLAVVGWLV
jgi:hypothetical protein